MDSEWPDPRLLALPASVIIYLGMRFIIRKLNYKFLIKKSDLSEE